MSNALSNKTMKKFMKMSLKAIIFIVFLCVFVLLFVIPSGKRCALKRRTEHSIENMELAKSLIEDRCLSILYEKHPQNYPLNEEILILEICYIKENDSILVTYFIKSNTLLEGENTYVLRHETLSLSELTTNEEELTLLRNNL